jgi:hypothetical protein
MLNTFWLHLCGGLTYAELSFDISEGLMRPTPFLRRCGASDRPK